MDKRVNLVKLSVGTESVESLMAWQEMRRKELPEGLPRHVTRMWPKREAELLNGGSIYWVIKGLIQCRQRILRLDELDRGDGIRRCAIVLDPDLHATAASPRRPFQGWRYLTAADAPPDLDEAGRQAVELPPEMADELRNLGLI